MSDDYRDGCSKKDVLSLSWLVVQVVYFASWLIPPRGRHRR